MDIYIYIYGLEVGAVLGYEFKYSSAYLAVITPNKIPLTTITAYL